jgi:dephospho-CoA kinase
MIKLVGLTGGIGTGKSTVAQFIRDQGIPVIDADVLAREVVQPGLPAHTEIVQAWPEILAADGSIDRKQLAAIVFADRQSRARLEAITHPRIRDRVKAEAAHFEAAGHRLAFLEAALLVETGFYKELDGLVVVTSNEATQMARVMARDACSREIAESRIRAQLPLAEKTRVADRVVDNGGSLEATQIKILHLLRELAPQTG